MSLLLHVLQPAAALCLLVRLVVRPRRSDAWERSLDGEGTLRAVEWGLLLEFSILVVVSDYTVCAALG